MSAYTDAEKSLAVAQFGPKDPKHPSTDSGPPDWAAQFAEVQEIVAWGFISNPDVIYSFVKMAVRTLLEKNVAFLAQLTVLSGALADMENSPTSVASIENLDEAISNAKEMKTALAAGGATKDALTRFSEGIDLFLGTLGDTSRAGGVSRTPVDEASDKADAALREMEDAYATMLVLVTGIRAACTDWDEVDLSKIAGASPLDSIVTRLEALKKNPSDRQRASSLELLSSIARMDAAINPRDPCVAKVSSTGAGGDSTGNSHGPKALATGTTSGPHNIGPLPGASLAVPTTNPGNHVLKLDLNELLTKTFTLPSSTRASVIGRTFADVTLVATGPAILITPGVENFDFEIATGGPVTVYTLDDDGLGVGVVLEDTANSPFANAKEGDLAHPDGLGWGSAGRIVHVLDDDRAVIMGQHGFLDGHANFTVFRDNRLTVVTDGVAETVLLDLIDNHPYTAAKAAALIAAAILRATVEVDPQDATKARLTSNTGLPEEETSLAIAASRANSVFGWDDDPEETSPYPDPNPNKATGSVGNDQLVLAVDEPLYAGNPLRDDSAGAGRHIPIKVEVAGKATLAEIVAHLNGQDDFTGPADGSAPRAYAQATDGRLVIRSQRYGPVGSVRIISETWGPASYRTATTVVNLLRVGDDTMQLSGPAWQSGTFFVGDYINANLVAGPDVFVSGPAKILELVDATTILVRLPDQESPAADDVGGNTYEWYLFPALRSTCLETLGLPADQLIRGKDVTNQQLKDFLEDTTAGTNIDGEAKVLAAKPMLAKVELQIDEDGDITVLSGDPNVGEVALLEGDVGGTYHVIVKALPAISLTPDFAPGTLPAAGKTINVNARIGPDPFVLESTKITKASSIKSLSDANDANTELGLTGDLDVRGHTDVWDDASVDLLDKGVAPTDLLTIAGDSVAKEIVTAAAASVGLKLGTAVTDVTKNDSGTTYSIKSKGLTEQERIAKDATSPLPTWQDDVLTGDDEFELGLAKLRDAVNRAVNGSDLQRRRAVGLASRLTAIWDDSAAPDGLQTVLTTYDAPVFDEADAILQALQEMRMDAGAALLRQARFVDFFDLTGDTSLPSGGLIKSMVDLAQEDFAASPDMLEDSGARSSTAPSPDADYLHDDLGTGFRAVASGTDGEAEDVDEVY